MDSGQENKEIIKAFLKMNRRNDDRIDLQLPCTVLFPEIWGASMEGLTANLNRKSMLVECTVSPGKKLPTVGAEGFVHIELPQNHRFGQKLIRCNTTLIRIEEVGEDAFHFAMQIGAVRFDDASPALELMKLDPETCSYVM